jgi:hypothetical protein
MEEQAGPLVNAARYAVDGRQFVSTISESTGVLLCNNG